jgi:hypothetical protein
MLEDKMRATYSAVLGLRNEEVDDSGLNSTPDGEDNIRAPSDLLQGNRPCELVQETSSGNGEARETHTLCTHFEREDFNGIQGLERSEAYRVDGTKDKDECERCRSCGLVRTSSPTRGDRFLIQRRSYGHCQPDHTAAGIGEQEERSSANTVHQIGSEQRPAELLAVIDQSDIGLSNRTANSNGGQDFAKEV